MKDITFVDVSGFFTSGSSAMVDLLKEFRGAYESNAEIRFIRDPYGIIPMENTLVNQWDWINSSAAISDFLTIMRKSTRRKGLCLPMGFSLKKNISPDIMQITKDYIAELTDYTYHIDFYHYKFKKSFIKYQIDRYRWGIERLTRGKWKVANRNIEDCYFAHPTQERFNKATKSYFNKLFANHVKEGEKTFIILDQAIPSNNTQVIHRYFNKAKMIIIDRDPRDMFVDDILWGENLDRDQLSIDAAKKFIIRSKAMREGIVLDDDTIYVRFEDLIIDYDKTRLKILKFLGLDESDHIKKKECLKPEVSIKNIGIWRKFYGQCREAIDLIEKELPELCYDSDFLYDNEI